MQVKRLHEYKRQHLNALNILADYLMIKANPSIDYTPHTYIFGAKAAAGYYMAKKIISFIYALGEMINNDPDVNGRLKVVYIEDYNVTMAEKLMPAADISEQISLAGTEASGTGNMKLMLNGAITLGTMDGANIEIHDAVGSDNILYFGMKTPEVNELKRRGYNPMNYYNNNQELHNVIDFIAKMILQESVSPKLPTSSTMTRIWFLPILPITDVCSSTPFPFGRIRKVAADVAYEHLRCRHLLGRQGNT